MQITMHFIRFFNKYSKFITLFISTLFHRKLIGTSSEARAMFVLISNCFTIPYNPPTDRIFRRKVYSILEHYIHSVFANASPPMAMY